MTAKRLVAFSAALTLAVPVARASDTATCGGPVRVSVTGGAEPVLTMQNGCIGRRWAGAGAATAWDERTGFSTTASTDFRLFAGGQPIPAAAVGMTDVAVEGDGTARATATMRLSIPVGAGVVSVERRASMFAGIAATRIETTIASTAPFPLTTYTLDRLAVGSGASTRIHAFRAGGDWREPGWQPPLAIGDPRTGDWRATTAAGPGAPVEGNGEWMSVATPPGEHVAMVLERRNAAASRMSYDGDAAAATVDLSRDVVYFGPFEESVHAENPAGGPARARIVGPAPMTLEPVITILGADADDEPWHFHRILTEHLRGGYHRGVIFNSDQVDSNQRSTGAKDDMDYERFVQILDEVREIGADTFVFDDGWQARSGDFCPDADVPGCTEPRWDGTPTSKFRPRFPDATFSAVREKLAGDPSTAADDIALGLWMNPMSYHPSAYAYQDNPQWSCAPVGTGTGAVSIVDPNGSSNEAGIGLWNPLALGVDPDDGATPMRMIDYLEGRILRAVEEYGARYFKFDFLVWVDCAGVEPADMYAYHDAFVAMLDRVQAAHPDVVYQIDDTNDYRMFPYETVTRGPSWFVNGSPSISQQLHNVWSLAPEVPGYALGARILSNSADRARGVDPNMAAALPQHITISMPVDTVFASATDRARIKRWTDFYKRYRHEIATMTYPLLQDPAAGDWTALQPWNRDAATGWLLAYRQRGAAATQTIGLRGIPQAGTFSLTRHDPGSDGVEDLGTWDASQLRAGIPVTIPAEYGYALIRIARD